MRTFGRLVIILCIIIACDEVADALGGQAGVSVRIPRAIPNKISKKSDHIQIHQVKLLLDRIKFTNSENDSVDFSTGPHIVVLDTNFTSAQVDEVELQDGTYNQISFKVHKPNPNEVIADSSFTDGGRFSIIVSGVMHDSIDFVFKGDKTLIQHLQIDPPFIIDGGETDYNVTIFIDTDTWFVDGATDLNPLNPSDNNKIGNNIKASFRAFKDNDNDGEED